MKWNREEVERVLDSNFSNESMVHPETDFSIHFQSKGFHHELYVFGHSESCWIRGDVSFPFSRPITEFTFRCDLIEVKVSPEPANSIWSEQIQFHFTDGNHISSNSSMRFAINRDSNDFLSVWGVIGSQDPDKPRL